MSRVSFALAENDRQSHWKATATHLPDAARAPGVYRRDAKASKPASFCLPRELASLNLLPGIRESALAVFADLDIVWHDSVDGGPSNHLRDSQVQCVNALAPMMRDAGRIQAGFGDVLDIDSVTEIEPGRFLTFEYIGPFDYFGESPRSPRTRGSKCTSVDAAFSYRTSTGGHELALIEWKYTEKYSGTNKPDPKRDSIRLRRYREDYERPDGPLRGDLVPLEAMLTEPLYQLARQQLLADRIESDPATPFDTVRVLHVLNPANDAYQSSLRAPEHLALGTTVSEVWQRLLRRPDRFLNLDPARFLSPDVTSDHYVERYGSAFAPLQDG